MALPRENRLNVSVRFILFVTSYAPLFLLIIISQISKSPDGLVYGGLKLGAVCLFLKYFGVSLVFALLMLIAFLGLRIFIKSVDVDVDSSGVGIVIEELENKNSESIGYIGTYIIPFLFNDYSSPYSVISLFVLMMVVYCIYIQSSLIIVNPVLNIFYSLYEVRFGDSSGLSKRGMLITKQKYLSEGDNLNVVRIGHKLYIGRVAGG